LNVYAVWGGLDVGTNCVLGIDTLGVLPISPIFTNLPVVNPPVVPKPPNVVLYPNP
jgi:hypothetical protein